MKSSWNIRDWSLKDPILTVLLRNRGIDSRRSKEYLNPPEPTLKSAVSSLKLNKTELSKTVVVIKEAMDGGKPIIIHGDYDVDGIVSTAILWRTIYQELAYKRCFPFIPGRFEHGYGLSRKSIDSILSDPERGPLKRALLITVDCGITAIEGVEYAKEMGFDVLVIDHHLKPKKLPKCSIFWSDLVCASVLSWVVSQKLKEDPERFVDLAAVATVADLQPLLGFNRSLVKCGLKGLKRTDNLGLKSLMSVAGISDREIGTFDVGWIIAPRINASGRLESAWDALRLLCSRNADDTLKLARKLNCLNKERQEMTKAAFELALGAVERGSKVNVVVHEEFHEGIIGLVAGKLVSAFRAPAVVVSKGKEFSKASARSVEGFNIIEFLRSLGDHFVDIGGHAGAAGFTIRSEKIEEFVSLVNVSQKEIEIPMSTLNIDRQLSFDEIEHDLFEVLDKMAPFGIGNSEPLFLTKGASIEKILVVGNGKSHLKLLLHSPEKNLPALYFGKAEMINELKVGGKVDVVYSLSKDEWNGQKNISLKIRDLDKAL